MVCELTNCFFSTDCHWISRSLGKQRATWVFEAKGGDVKNLRIAVKLSIVTGILLLIMGALGALAINRLAVVNDQSTIISKKLAA